MMNLINRMEVAEYNELAERVHKIMSFKDRSEWFAKKNMGEDDEKSKELVKKNIRSANNCVRKTNAFFEYAKRKGCNWEEFEKEYYGGDDVEEKKKEVTKPKKE